VRGINRLGKNPCDAPQSACEGRGGAVCGQPPLTPDEEEFLRRMNSPEANARVEAKRKRLQEFVKTMEAAERPSEEALRTRVTI
jgi:hypothetical protein